MSMVQEHTAVLREEGARTLNELLDDLERAAIVQGKVSLGAVFDSIGRRSFGPMLLAAGLLAATPLGVIPGAPTALGLAVVLIAGQMLLGRESFWLPERLLKLKVPASRMHKAVRFARPLARTTDRILRPRFTGLTTGASSRIVAGTCVVMGLAIPPLELVPFAVFAPASAVTAFGLGLIARDGLVTLLAMAVSLGSLAALGFALV